jgi:hypothetical protein
MPPRYVFTLVSGHNFRTRAIGFLEDAGNDEMDAKSVFESLPPVQFSLVNARFGHWLSRAVFDKYFHGFAGKYNECFVFKWEARHIPQRLYGFLCHPRPRSDLPFELCVLMYFATKGDDTNYTILDRINRVKTDIAVKAAMSQQYPEFTGRKPWTIN